MKKKSISLTDEDIFLLTSRFKILSEPSRLRIIRSLFSGEKCVKEIVASTGLMQANVSKQLKLLSESGAVTCRPAGLQRFYQISDMTIYNLCEMLCLDSKK